MEWHVLQLLPTHPKPVKMVWCTDVPLPVGMPVQMVAVLEMDCSQTQMCKRQILVF